MIRSMLATGTDQEDPGILTSRWEGDQVRYHVIGINLWKLLSYNDYLITASGDTDTID